MKYPSEFPQDARARVEAETLRAYDALEQDVRGIESWRREVPFIRCIMRVFLVFVREACAFAKNSNHPAWSDRELDQRCRDFLLSIVIDAWEDKAKDLGIRKMASSQGWGYSLDDDDRRKIEKSPEWKQYKELLLDAFDTQSARAADCNLPQPEQAGDMASKAEAVESAKPAAMSNAKNPAQILPDEEITEGAMADLRELSEPIARRLATQSKQPAAAEKRGAATVRTVPVARRHGFKADMDRHKAIAEIVTRHVPTWLQGSTAWKRRDLLQSICTDLDNAASLDESGLYEIPKSWKKGGKTQALGGLGANSWSDALQLASKKLVTDQINASLKMVLKPRSTS
jgi:hypothetical protein